MPVELIEDPILANGRVWQTFDFCRLARLAKIEENLPRPTIVSMRNIMPEFMDVRHFPEDASVRVLDKNRVYTAEDILGDGAFGKVFSGRRLNKDSISETPVAIKIIPLANDHMWDTTIAEIETLEKLEKMSSVPGLLDYFLVNDQCGDQHAAIIMERPVHSKDLFCHSQEVIAGKQAPFTEMELMSIILQLYTITQELRKWGIFHPDIKMENVLLDRATSVIHLIDFGNIFQYPEGKACLGEFKGTLDSAPPEMFAPMDDNKPARIKKFLFYQPKPYLVWSIGLIAYELARGQSRSHVNFNVRADLKGMNYSPEMVTFLEACLRPDPKDRLDFDALANKQPWFIRPAIHQKPVKRKLVVLEETNHSKKMKSETISSHLKILDVFSCSPIADKSMRSLGRN